MRDPVTRTFSDLYHVKFAPEDDMHGLIAEKLWLLLQNKRFLPNIKRQICSEKTYIYIEEGNIVKTQPSLNSKQLNTTRVEVRHSGHCQLTTTTTFY